MAGHVAVGSEKVGEVKEGCNCGIVTVSYTDPRRDAVYAPACTECMEIQTVLDVHQALAELDAEFPDATAPEAEDFALSPPAEDLDLDLGGCECLALTPTEVTFPCFAEADTPHSFTAGVNHHGPEQLDVFGHLADNVDMHLSYNDEPPFHYLN